MKRIPPWAVIVAFAAVIGGAIALVALRRGKAIEEFCASRLPVVPGYDRTTSDCRTVYTVRGKSVLVAIRRKDAFAARLAELEAKHRLAAERIEGGAILETTVQATAPTRIILLGTDGDLVEVHFDPAVFERERSLALVRGL